MPPSKGETNIDPEGELDALLASDGFTNDYDHPTKPVFASRWFKWVRRLALAALLMTALAAAGIYLLLHLADTEPEFYKQALSVDPELQRKNGSEMETRILDLRNSVLIADSWSASFSEAQLNGWLAWDLKKKFPNLVPPEINNPQLLVGEQSVTLAFRCNVKPFRGVAIIDADVFMTGVLNQIGIRVKSIHSGLIPIPVAAFANQITEQAKNSGVEIQWKNEGSETIAIIDLPDAMIKPNDGGSYIELQTLSIDKGKISIGGITHPPDF